MKPNINHLIKIISQINTSTEPVVEIGSFQVPGQEHYANLRPYFEGKQYIGCDMRKGMGVDRIENIEKLSFKDNSVGTLLCLETYEHVWDIFKATSEVMRVLKPGGLLVLSTVFNHPIHDHPSDYWRFTPESLNQLYKALNPRLVGWEGEPENPHTVFIVGYKHGDKKQSAILKTIAQAYTQYFDTKPSESLRLQLRKWRHQPMQQIRKHISVKEEFNFSLNS